MKTGKLVQKLHEGFILYKDHHGNTEFREYLISDGPGCYSLKGWCSAIGNVNDRLVELITNPQLWKVMEFNHLEQESPYPWSVKFAKNVE